MTDGEGCPGGGTECDYGELHALTLVEKIMRAIDQFNRDVKASPCPACLRDVMLAVAALLHIEAARLEGKSAPAKALEDRFAEAARDRLEAVIQAAALTPAGIRQ